MDILNWSFSELLCSIRNKMIKQTNNRQFSTNNLIWFDHHALFPPSQPGALVQLSHHHDLQHGQLSGFHIYAFKITTLFCESELIVLTFRIKSELLKLFRSSFFCDMYDCILFVLSSFSLNLTQVFKQCEEEEGALSPTAKAILSKIINFPLLP